MITRTQAVVRVVMAALVLFHCLASVPTAFAGPGGGARERAEPLVIYVAGSFTGIMPFLAEGIHEAALVFASRVNDAGGLKGRPVRVEKQDDQADVERAIKNATRALSDPNHLVTIGHPFSSVAIPIAKLYKAKQKIFMSPYATSADLSKVGGTTFQLCFNDVFQGETLAHVAAGRLNAKRVLVLRNMSDPYSDGLAETFISAAKRLGGSLEVSEFKYITGGFDPESFGELMRGTRPDVVFLPELKVRAAEILRDIERKGVTLPAVLGADGWGSESGTLDIFFDNAARSKGEQRYFYTYHWHPGIKTPRNELVKSLIEKATKKSAYGPGMLAFDGLDWLADAVRATGSFDGAVVADRLRNRTYDGVTGPVTLSGSGQSLRSLVLVELSPAGLRFDSLVTPSGK